MDYNISDMLALMKLSYPGDSPEPEPEPQRHYQYRLSSDLRSCSLSFALSVLGELCCFCCRINGETIDIRDAAFLSAGEYVLVYFIELEMSSEDRDVISTCSDLLPMRDDFELLLVFKGQDLLHYSSSSFSYSDLLSKLPSSCILALLKGQAHYDDVRTYFSDSDAASKFFLVNLKANTFYSGSRCINLLFNLFRDCIIRWTWPVIPEEQSKPPLSEYDCPLTRILNSVYPDYSDNNIQDMMTVPSSIEVGKYFDVLSLLSCGGHLKYLHRLTGGEPVKLEEKTFRGKYIMVCCAHAPITRSDFMSRLLQAVSTVCSELFTRDHIDIELVVVPKMNKLANHEAVYNHFLSGFPSVCLAVPFKDSQCCDFICNYLGIHYPSSIQCLLLDTDRNVLMYEPPFVLLNYGAEGFPFTPQAVEDIHYRDCTMWHNPSESKLATLMGCSPSDILYKVNPADYREKITVSELSKKVVGLYLCLEKEIDLVHLKVLEECRDKQLPIEIVLVYYPLGDCLDPNVFQQHINSLLKELNVDWWRLPYNDSISRRFKRLTLCEPYNKIVIVGPHGKYVDPYGGNVMKYYGSDLFPFTREELVQGVLRKLSVLTLDSLLSHYDHVQRGNKKISVADLPAMNVLVYFGTLFDDCLYEEVSTKYHKLKEEIEDFEIIFIRRNGRQVEGADELISNMPWLVCPFNAFVSDFLQDLIFVQVGTGKAGDSLVEFGKDGHLCSLSHRCISDEPADRRNAFKENLRQDVIAELCDRNFHFDFLFDFQ